MRVTFVSSSDEHHHPMLTLDLDPIPRVGERLYFRGHDTLDIPLGWWVVYISHRLELAQDRLIEQTAQIVMTAHREEPRQVWVEWEDPMECPSWLAAEELLLFCDTIPQRGDILELGINDEHYAQSGAPHLLVEVASVIHNSLLEPSPELPEGSAILSETQTGITVRAISANKQRVIFRHN